METRLGEEQIWLGLGSLMVLALIALSWGLAMAKGILVPFVLAWFLVVLVSPAVDYQVNQWKMPRWLAISSTLLLVVVALSLVVLLLTFAVYQIRLAISDYTDGISQMTSDLIEEVNQFLRRWNITVNDGDLSGELGRHVSSLVGQSVGTVYEVVVNGFLVAIFVLFLLSGRHATESRHQSIYLEIETAIRRYLGTKFVISAVTGLLVWVILRMMGLHLAMVFGLLAFLLNFIPSIGSAIATLLPIPVALAQFGDSPGMLALTVGLPGSVQMVVGNVVEPRVMGQGLSLHPVAVLLALAFWGLLWGAIGAVLAVPITAAIRIVMLRFDTTRWIGDLLAGKLP